MEMISQSPNQADAGKQHLLSKRSFQDERKLKHPALYTEDIVPSPVDRHSLTIRGIIF